MSFNTTLLTCLTLTSFAFADTFTVDDDGGADFTEITDAILAASAGDLILVEPGSYTDFTLSKGVTVMGTAPGVEVVAGSRISSLAANRRAILVDLAMVDLSVVNNTGTVVLDTVAFGIGTSNGASSVLTVANSPDVRLADCTVAGHLGTSGLSADASRVEGVSSNFTGGAGAGVGADGRDAVFASGSSRLHLAGSSAQGGRGADGNFATCISFSAVPGGDGGAGVAFNSSDGFVMGAAGDLLKGGAGGLGDVCDCDGSGGNGIFATNSGSARWSGVTLEGGDTFCFGEAPGSGSNFGGSVSQASPAEPYLTKQFVPSAGSPVRFVVNGEPGDTALLYLGRSPIVQPLAPFEIEQLSTRERTFPLGTIGATGNATFLLTVPGNLPRGFNFYAQAEVISGSGSGPYLTNSLPIVLR